MNRRHFLTLPALAASRRLTAAEDLHVLPLLPPGPGNPRNTEGGFVRLKDGRLLFAYTKFTGGGGDHDTASIVSRESKDGGATWSSDDRPVLENEGGMNVMSVSLLRAKDGRILFFYLRKNSVTDCHVLLRTSKDETKSWSDPVDCTPDPGYFVLNNDRAVQLKRGRLVLPVALHTHNNAWSGRGTVMFYLSDDAGKTWRRSKDVMECPTSSGAGLQEPGVVELKDGRLMVFCRTRLGSQYVAHSRDGGETWTRPEPSPLLSPLSPASIERIPKTGHLLAVWNDHANVDPAMRADDAASRGGLRTPLTVAISRDEGKTWINHRNILDDPKGWYCYTAIEFWRDRVLLAFASGGSGLPHLSRTQVAWFPVSYLYP